MPRIIVTADRPTDGGDRPVMFTERVSESDFESEHFRTQLVERLGWAVGDAAAVEQSGLVRDTRESEPEPVELDRELSDREPEPVELDREPSDREPEPVELEREPVEFLEDVAPPPVMALSGHYR
jgi:hypothetical protein